MDPVLLAVAGFAFVVLLVLASAFASCYKKCGPAEALIVTGYFEAPGVSTKVIAGGGGQFVIPLLQRVEVISLGLMSMDLKNTSAFPTADSRGLCFNAVMEFSIDKNPDALVKAAGLFGGKREKEIRSIVYDIVYDHLRQIVATIKGDNVQAKIDQLAGAVLRQAGQDLATRGIHLSGFRIKEIREVRTHLGDPAATASYSSLPALMASSGVNFGSIGSNGNKIAIGTIAVVSNTITSDQPGEVTYSLQHGARSVKTAKTRMPGMKIDIGAAVVIMDLDSDSVFVDCWSPIHAHMPALQQ